MRRVSALALIFSITGCYLGPMVSIPVTSTNAENYYVVSVNEWRDLGRSDAERSAALLADPYFGPFPTNQSKKLRPSRNYYLVPVCSDKLAVDQKSQLVAAPHMKTDLKC